MARKANISKRDNFFAGDDFLIDFIIFANNNPDDDSRINITSLPLQYQIVDDVDNPTVTITKTVGSGITITDGANGEGQILIDSADTEALSPGVYEHSLKDESGGGEEILFFGCATLQKTSQT